MTELVSILIPCYNAERWMHETIESALYQTWPNKEIIIVDDGSTDNSLKIARQYESNLVQVISQENKGAPAARNAALENARGDYIQWLDADDMLAPDKIEKQMEVAHRIGNPKVLLSCSWGRFFYRHWKANFIADSLWRDLSPVEWLIASFSASDWMSNSAWLVSRTLTELAGPWDERLTKNQDGEYFCRVIARCDNVVFVPEAREYVRRSNSRSVSISLSRRALESLFLSKNLCIRYLLFLEDSKRTRKACIDFLQLGLEYYYPDHTDLANKARDLALELGGTLSPPELRWRLAMLKTILGYSLAERARQSWFALKIMIIGAWDKLLWRLSSKSTAPCFKRNK
jgi:glycosyltransferase involved in cell wall biosynthesis